MKIILFGGSGFIGKNVMKKFPKNSIVPISLREDEWKNNLPSDTEVFINLIGKAHDHKGVARYEDYYEANVELTKQIFNEFFKSKATLLIHISSIAALEEFASLHPLNEEDLNNPISHYGKTKREAELWLLRQKLPQEKKIIILRPPLVHGEGDKGNLELLYKFISKGIPYPLSAFQNSRSFLSIDNFIFFLKEIISNQDKLDSGIYHIADDEVLSTKEILEIIKRVENKKIIDLYIPPIVIKVLAKIGDFSPFPLNTKRLKKMTSNLEVSNQKIKSVLEIKKLPISAEKGIEITIKSFK